MKYRHIELECSNMCGGCFVTLKLQVKKWYGWVTFMDIQDSYVRAYQRAEDIIKALKGDSE